MLVYWLTVCALVNSAMAGVAGLQSRSMLARVCRASSMVRASATPQCGFEPVVLNTASYRLLVRRAVRCAGPPAGCCADHP